MVGKEIYDKITEVLNGYDKPNFKKVGLTVLGGQFVDENTCGKISIIHGNINCVAQGILQSLTDEQDCVQFIPIFRAALLGFIELSSEKQFMNLFAGCPTGRQENIIVALDERFKAIFGNIGESEDAKG